MAPEKAPAFQFYPRDWDTDVNVIPMTYEEEGVYFALCRRVWLDGTLPSDLNELRVLLKGRPTLKQMERWWSRIGKCFDLIDGRLVHPRLERERKKQRDWQPIASEGGKARAASATRDAGKFTSKAAGTTHHQETSKAAGVTTSPAFASSSASSSASSEKEGSARAPSLVGSSMQWHREHGTHVEGFCTFVCFPRSLFDEFVTRVAGAGFVNPEERVLAWATKVRADWQSDGRIVGDSRFDFWKHEWLKVHGSNRPSTGVDVTAGLRGA